MAQPDTSAPDASEPPVSSQASQPGTPDNAPQQMGQPGPPPSPGQAGFPFGLISQPGQSAIPPPALQLMIQSGLVGHQQNPEAIKHMTDFLAHDSDNRLTLLSATAKRNHALKMWVLFFIMAITGVLLSIPFISILMTGDVSQAISLIGQGATWIVPILLALVAGPSIKELLSK